MAGPTPVQIRRTSTADKVPSTSELLNVGELGLNMTDARLFFRDGSNNIKELGANIQNQVITDDLTIGGGTTANSTQISTDEISIDTGLYVGANVDLTTSYLFIGNSTVNAVANSLSLRFQNSTVDFSLTKPTAAQVSSADYYLASDGTWKQTGSAASPIDVNIDNPDTDEIYSWEFGDVNSNEFHLTIDDLNANTYITSKVIVQHTGGLAADFNEYAILSSNASVETLGDYSANANSTHVRVYFAPSVANVNVYGTTLASVTYNIDQTAYTAAGSDKEIQFNDATNANGDPSFTWNKVAGTMSIGGANFFYASASNTGAAGPDLVDQFAKATFRGGEVLYTVVNSSANNKQVGKLLIVHNDGTGEQFYNEYGVVWSNTAQGSIGSFTCNADATNVRLYFDPVSTINYTVQLGYTLFDL